MDLSDKKSIVSILNTSKIDYMQKHCSSLYIYFAGKSTITISDIDKWKICEGRGPSSGYNYTLLDFVKHEYIIQIDYNNKEIKILK